MNRYLEFKTKGGNSYLFDSKSCLVFQKERGSDEEFIKNVDFLSEYNQIDNQLEINEENTEQYILKYGLKELLLECTTSCNLRCHYCVFSGNYDDKRIHGTAHMSIETAQKAISYYLYLCRKAKKINPLLKPMIGFYGGEPLLNMELIRYSIEYIKKNFWDFKDIYLTLTTNGTMLIPETVDYLLENDVHVILSLDGGREQHNRNRVFKNNKGSFDIIMQNLEYYFKKKSYIFTNSVFDYKTNLLEVADFFQNNPRFINIGAAPVNKEGTTYYDQFTEEDVKIFNERLQKVREIFLNDFIDDSHANSFIRYWMSKDCSSALTRVPFNLKQGYIPYTGGCVPGDKMFVNVNGNILVCEKLSEDFKIGDIKNGLDFNQIAKMVKEYNKTIEKCKDCVIRNVCSFCYGSCGKKGIMEIEAEKCRNAIEGFRQRLELCYSVLEVDEGWFALFQQRNNELIDRRL